MTDLTTLIIIVAAFSLLLTVLIVIEKFWQGLRDYEREADDKLQRLVDEAYAVTLANRAEEIASWLPERCPERPKQGVDALPSLTNVRRER